MKGAALMSVSLCWSSWQDDKRTESVDGLHQNGEDTWGNWLFSCGWSFCTEWIESTHVVSHPALWTLCLSLLLFSLLLTSGYRRNQVVHAYKMEGVTHMSFSVNSSSREDSHQMSLTISHLELVDLHFVQACTLHFILYWAAVVLTVL